MKFGDFVRKTREKLKEQDKKYSVRKVAMRVGIEPAYLSKIERGDFPPPSEDTIRRIASELSLDVDALLAMGGKVSKDLHEIIMKRPRLFADLIRELKETSDKSLLRIVREVRDGEW
jgi:HTH-type transcriptional regulator, competence development regulator